MHYIPNLLIKQQGGRFCFAWIAATRGIGYVPKPDLVATDIVKLCADMTVWIQTSSKRRSMRLSLTLSSRLINGMVKIHRRQVELMLEEIVKFLTQTKMPQGLLLSDGSQETVIPKVRTKRKRRPVNEIPDTPASLDTEVPVFKLNDGISLDNILNRPSTNQVNEDLITMRENLIPPSSTHIDEGRFGDFDVYPDNIEPSEDVPLPYVIPSEVAPVTTDDKEARPRKKRRTEITEIEPLPNLVNQLHSTEDDIRPIQQQVPIEEQGPIEKQVPIEEQVQIEEQIPIVELVEPQIDAPSLRAMPTVVRRKIDKLHIKIARIRRFVNINQPDYDQDTIFAPEIDIQPPLEVCVPLKEVDIASWLSEFMLHPEAFRELADSNTRGSLQQSPNFGLRFPRRSNSVGSRIRTERSVSQSPVTATGNQLLVPVEVHRPHYHSVQQTIVENEDVQEPIAKSTSIGTPVAQNLPVWESAPDTIEICAPAVAQQNGNVHQAMKPIVEEPKTLSRRDRQKRIKHIVKNWVGGDINLEDFCFHPITRQNIAVTFTDLLSMQVMGYVKLNNKLNSSELGTIEKGVKLLT